jgi:hypothetical protein
MEDKFLLEIYMQGFNDELDGNPEKIFPSELLKRAYVIGRMDAIAGDESKIVDYQIEEQILNHIKQIK